MKPASVAVWPQTKSIVSNVFSAWVIGMLITDCDHPQNMWQCWVVKTPNHYQPTFWTVSLKNHPQEYKKQTINIHQPSMNKELAEWRLKSDSSRLTWDSWRPNQQGQGGLVKNVMPMDQNCCLWYQRLSKHQNHQTILSLQEVQLASFLVWKTITGLGRLRRRPEICCTRPSPGSCRCQDGDPSYFGCGG